jgi:hypothetical protein
MFPAIGTRWISLEMDLRYQMILAKKTKGRGREMWFVGLPRQMPAIAMNSSDETEKAIQRQRYEVALLSVSRG